jgi:hypothetical protein
MPKAEEALASHLSAESASSLKAPALPSKPLRNTSALVGKAYLAAGQATACLHTMSILQEYQADVLKDVSESEEVSTDVVRELRQAADLSLRATKESAKTYGPYYGSPGGRRETSLVKFVRYEGEGEGFSSGRSTVSLWSVW